MCGESKSVVSDFKFLHSKIVPYTFEFSPRKVFKDLLKGFRNILVGAKALVLLASLVVVDSSDYIQRIQSTPQGTGYQEQLLFIAQTQLKPMQETS